MPISGRIRWREKRATSSWLRVTVLVSGGNMAATADKRLLFCSMAAPGWGVPRNRPRPLAKYQWAGAEDGLIGPPTRHPGPPLSTGCSGGQSQRSTPNCGARRGADPGLKAAGLPGDGNGPPQQENPLVAAVLLGCNQFERIHHKAIRAAVDLVQVLRFPVGIPGLMGLLRPVGTPHIPTGPDALQVQGPSMAPAQEERTTLLRPCHGKSAPQCGQKFPAELERHWHLHHILIIVRMAHPPGS